MASQSGPEYHLNLSLHRRLAQSATSSKDILEQSAFRKGGLFRERVEKDKHNGESRERSPSEISVDDFPPVDDAPDRVQVTDDDLRRMARYKYEKRNVWHRYPSLSSRWAAFARLPKVGPYQNFCHDVSKPRVPTEPAPISVRLAQR